MYQTLHLIVYKSIDWGLTMLLEILKVCELFDSIYNSSKCPSVDLSFHKAATILLVSDKYQVSS